MRWSLKTMCDPGISYFGMWQSVHLVVPTLQMRLAATEFDPAEWQLLHFAS
jgi:hypothetical protein